MVIGPGGKTIRGIVEETGATVDVEDDGTVTIGSSDSKASDRATEMIKDLTREVKTGEIFTGKVVKITGFGAFVQILAWQGRHGAHQRACRLPRPQRGGRRIGGRGDHRRRHRRRSNWEGQALPEGPSPGRWRWTGYAAAGAGCVRRPL